VNADDEARVDLDLAGLNPATGLLDPSYTRQFDGVNELMLELQDARVWPLGPAARAHCESSSGV
jgi:hypothetical protein